MDAKYAEKRRKIIWMNYVADSLYYQPREQMFTARYKDIVDRKYVDNRSGEEIISDVMERGGLRFEE